MLFHCYLLFKVNKWCIFNCFTSLENATGRPTPGYFFSPFISACISFLFLFVGHLSCEARSIGQKISKGHHRAMVAALSYTFCTEHMRLNCSFPVLNQCSLNPSHKRTTTGRSLNIPGWFWHHRPVCTISLLYESRFVRVFFSTFAYSLDTKMMRFINSWL